MASVGTIVANLVAKTHGYTSPIKQAQGVTASFGKTMDSIADKAEKMERKLGKVQKTTMAWAAALTAAGVGLAGLASDAEETQAKFNIVFGEMSKDTNAWAKEFSRTIGRSETDIKGWSSEIQNTLGAIGFSRGPAAELSKNLTELAVDVGAFMNAADKDVIDNFLSAMTGSTMAVRKYGIVINQTTLAEELRRMGVRKSVTQVDELTKTQARYNIIMRATQDAQGAALREADGWANQIKSLGGDLRNLGDDMGARVLAPGVRMIGWLRDGVKWFSDLDDELKTNIMRWAFMGTVVLAAISAFALFGTALLKVIQAVTLFGKAVALIAPAALWLGLIAAAAYLLYTAWTDNWFGIQDKTQAVWKVVEPILSDLWNWLQLSWEWAIKTSGDAWEWLTETTWAEKVDDIKGWLTDGWKWAINTSGDGWKWFTEETALGRKIEELRKQITDSAAWKWTIEAALPAILETGKAVIEVSVKAAGDLYDAVKTGLDTGDWGPFWSTASDVWSKGVLLGITISSAITGLGIAKTAIMAGLALLPAMGLPGALGAFTVGIQLMEAKTGGLGYKAFGANLFLALAAGLGIGMFTGSPYTGALAFTVVMNLKMGETIVDEFANIVDYIKYLLEDMTWTNILTKQYEDSKMSFGEWKHWNETGEGLYTAPSSPGHSVTIRPVGSGATREAAGWVNSATQITRQITEQERQMLAAIAYLEDGVNGVQAMTADIEVIFNRMDTNPAQYGATIEEVIRKAGQFEPVGRGLFDTLLASGNIPDEAFEAVDQALINMANNTQLVADALYFANLDIVRQRHEAAMAAGNTYAGSWMLDPTKMEPVLVLGDTTYGKKGPNYGKYSSGTPWTGSGPIDEIAGLVHKQEAVIPWKVLKNGGLAVLDFLGMPGFAEGRLAPGAGGGTGGFNWSLLVKTIADSVKDAISTGLETVLGEELYDKLTSGFDNVTKEIKGLMDDFGKIQEEIDKWKNPPEPKPLSWEDVGGDIWEMVKNTFVKAVPGLENAITAYQSAIEAGANPLQALATAGVALLMSTETFGKILQAFAYPVTVLFEVLGQALKPLVPVVEFFGDVVLFIAKAIATVWNTLLDLISLIPFVNLEKYKISIEEAERAAKRQTGAVDKATEAMRNVPQGLKLVWNRMNPTIPQDTGPIRVSGGFQSRGNQEPKSQTQEIHNHFHGPVYGMDDFDRRVNEVTGRTTRANSLVRNGV